MNAITEPSDEDLMVAVRAGDLDALDRLFARHHRRLYGFLVRLTHDHDLADDLVQEVFLRLLRFRESFREDGRFVPWLFRIARNLAADRHRAVSGTDPLGEIDPPASDDILQLDELIKIEDLEQLERALAALPLPHREVLLLRGVEGLSHRDVALALGCSEAAARVRGHRAMNALKREWRAKNGEQQ